MFEFLARRKSDQRVSRCRLGEHSLVSKYSGDNGHMTTTELQQVAGNHFVGVCAAMIYGHRRRRVRYKQAGNTFFQSPRLVIADVSSLEKRPGTPFQI